MLPEIRSLTSFLLYTIHEDRCSTFPPGLFVKCLFCLGESSAVVTAVFPGKGLRPLCLSETASLIPFRNTITHTCRDRNPRTFMNIILQIAISRRETGIYSILKMYFQSTCWVYKIVLLFAFDGCF